MESEFRDSVAAFPTLAWGALVEALCTTKSAGTEIGLSVSRSILDVRTPALEDATQVAKNL
jgi:hypothetical protein